VSYKPQHFCTLTPQEHGWRVRENKSLHPKQFQQMHGSVAVNTSQEMIEEKKFRNIFFSPRKTGLRWSHLLPGWPRMVHSSIDTQMLFSYFRWSHTNGLLHLVGQCRQAKQVSLLPGLVSSKLFCNGYTALSHTGIILLPLIFSSLFLFIGASSGDKSQNLYRKTFKVNGKLWDRQLSYSQFDTTT
jgi:hypothetical protein